TDCRCSVKIVSEYVRPRARLTQITHDSRRCIPFLQRSDALQPTDQRHQTSGAISMKKISIAFLAALSLASFGCKKKGGAEASAKMTEFRDRMCACKDKACADKVNDDLTKWTQEQAKEAKATEEDNKKMMQMSEEMRKCMQKIITDAASAGGAGAAGGAAGGAAAPAGGSDTGAAG